MIHLSTFNSIFSLFNITDIIIMILKPTLMKECLTTTTYINHIKAEEDRE